MDICAKNAGRVEAHRAHEASAETPTTSSWRARPIVDVHAQAGSTTVREVCVDEEGAPAAEQPEG